MRTRAFNRHPTTTLACLSLAIPLCFASTAAASTSRNPKILSGFSSSEHLSLKLAFGAAAKKVRSNESCRALFDNLDLGGPEALGRTYYEPATTHSDLALCGRGAVAITGVQGRRTRLCGNFNTHSRRDQAAILLHEALHIAGLSEKPIDPNGMTPHEITHLIKTVCGL